MKTRKEKRPELNVDTIESLLRYCNCFGKANADKKWILYEQSIAAPNLKSGKKL